MSSVLLINSNSLNIPLADKSVQMVATSPPYWNLREYGTAKWVGGDDACDHLAPARGGQNPERSGKQLTNAGTLAYQYTGRCEKCGAARVDEQLGVEQLHDCLGWATGAYCGNCYVCHTLAWAREIKRVLRDDGTFWLNLGDSYNGSGGAGGDYNEGGLKEGQPRYGGRNISTLKPKDMSGIPWRVALALQADGWWLRNDIIWHKPNPMPEGGARDRFTRAHEYIFLLSKSSRYYFDLEAVKEPAVQNRWGGHKPSSPANSKDNSNQYRGLTRERDMMPEMRNPRDVWAINTSRYKGAHFATWPPKLVEPMVKAGSRVGDIVLDPFAGSGTTLLTARQLGRSAIGLDLSYTYLHDQARRRLELDKLAAWTAE